MSNARTTPVSDSRLFSPSSSQRRRTSATGATTTRFDSSIPCSTSTSNDKATNSGDLMHRPVSSTATKAPALSDVVMAADYVARVNAQIERIGHAPDQATVLRMLRTIASTLGAENAAFVSFVRDSADISTCRFMLACQPGWCQRYLDAECLPHDPWLAYAAHHGEPIVASALHAVDLDARRVIDLASQNGFASAVLVPIHSGAGHSRISLLCLGSSQPGYFEGDGYARLRLGARLLAAELHDWWMARIRRELIVKARITSSDLDLLRHEHHGHSSKRIAAALQVSTSSINSRFQRMNTKLGVPNRRMAAHLAAECGLLD